jgi:MFS family permease
MSQFRSPGALWARVKRQADLVATGGSWSVTLDDGIRHNLRWFFMDGTFSSASDAITATYLTLFVLALGATSAQIGFMASLASVSAILLLIPGAMLSERFGKRKLVVLLTGGGVSRLTILLTAITPFLLHGQAAILVAIGLKVIADGVSNMSVPAWTSLTADIVPLRWRGRYFATRNIIMGLTNMVTTLLVGFLITQMASPGGYQVALGLAFVIGAVSTYSFSRLREPHTAQLAQLPGNTYTPAALWAVLKTNPAFLGFCAQALVWNLGLSIAGPFFNVYLVQNLKASAAMVGVVSIISSITSLPGQRLFGHLADHWGPRKVQIITGLLIPILPLSWTLITAPWQVILINILGGFLWAGYGIASFNFLLVLCPPEDRARYTALFQIIVMVATAIGSATGGLVVTHLGFKAVFLMSAILRVLGMLIFMYFIRMSAKRQPAEAAAPK